MDKWIEMLEKAIKWDPDYGDPQLCIQEIEGVIHKMKQADK
jgi:hypothetical protein